MSEKTNRNSPRYCEGEKILCYHGALIYEAKCLKVEKQQRSNEYSYFVHYNGWSKNWDEWVLAKRILKYNEENLRKQKELITEHKLAASRKKTTKSNNSSSNDDSTSLPTSSKSLTKTTTTKKGSSLENTESSSASKLNIENTESNKKKLSIIDISSMYDLDPLVEQPKIAIPEKLQDWLVDDLDFILEQNKIIQLPMAKSVSMILKEYEQFKLAQTEETITEEDKKYLPSLNENLNGFLRYFDSMLGSQLLYKFERLQYKEILKSKKQMSDVYGAIHLLRLMEKLNQILSCRLELEESSLDSLVYFATDILKFMERDVVNLFDEKNYINPPPFYVRASI